MTEAIDDVHVGQHVGRQLAVRYYLVPCFCFLVITSIQTIPLFQIFCLA